MFRSNNIVYWEVGDLIMKLCNPREYNYKYSSPFNSYGLIVESCTSNDMRFGNEPLWYHVLWGNGTNTWISNKDISLVKINESR
jgi:hypothetical protein